MYALHYEGTFVFSETKPEEVSSSQGIPTNVFLLKQPVVATPSGRQEVAHKHADDISGPVRVESKTGIVTDKLNNATGSTGSAMHDHPSAASVNDSKVVTTPKDEPDESKLQSEEPDVVYNPLANCTNPVKVNCCWCGIAVDNYSCYFVWFSFCSILNKNIFYIYSILQRQKATMSRNNSSLLKIIL